MAISVLPLDEAKSELGGTEQANYIFSYVQQMDEKDYCKTVVIESDYIDRDHLLDYQNYYSRSFRPVGRKVKRVHFFSNSFTLDEFNYALENNSIDQVCGYYLGFTIVKPVANKVNNHLC